MNKREDKNTKLKDLSLPLAALGTSAVAGKGFYDISKLDNNVNKSRESLEQLQRTLFAGKDSATEGAAGALSMQMKDADNIIDTYNKDMLNVSKSKLFGVPVGKGYAQGVKMSEAAQTIPNFTPRLKQAIINPREASKLYSDYARESKNLGKDYSTYLHHMLAFLDPEASVNTLRGHAIAQTIAEHLNAPLFPNNTAAKEALEGATSPEDMRSVLTNMVNEPGKYGFLHKEHSKRFSDNFLQLRNTEKKPIADHLSYLSGELNIPTKVRDYLIGPSPDSIEKRLDYIATHGDKLGLKDPDYVNELIKRIKEGILGGPAWKKDHRQVGKAMNMLGNNINVIGQGKGYATGIKDAIRKIKYPLLAAGIPLGLYGGKTLYDILKKSKMDKKAEITKEDVKESLPYIAAVPPAAYAAGHLSTPRDVAMTYGIGSRKYGGPEITAGHKNPAKAIKEILGDKKISPWYSRFFNVSDDVVRGPGGILNKPRSKPNILIDTGFGAISIPSEDQVSTPRFSNSVEKTRPLSVMSYQTDVAPSSMRHAGATSLADPRTYGNVKREILGYGPNIKEYVQLMRKHNPKAMDKVDLKYLGNSFGPAVMEAAIDNASTGVDKDKLFDEIKDFYKEDPNLIKQLDDVKDKKLIIVSGSTRGDYVAERTRQIAEQIRLQGVSDKVAVIGQFGDALKDPLTRRIIGDEDVITLGKMPIGLYTGLQNVADKHLASSGASAAAEAALMSSPISMPKDWGKWSQRPKKGSLAGKTYEAALKIGVEELAQEFNIEDKNVLSAIIEKMSDLPEGGAGGIFDTAGKIVSGDTGALDDETSAIVRKVRNYLGDADKKKFANKLVDLIESGDINGIADRIAPIADWNEGIVQRMHTLKGTSDYDPTKIIKDVLDDNILNADKAKSVVRSAEELKNLRSTRKILNNSIYSRALKNYLGSKGKMLGAAGIATALLGLGLYQTNKGDKKRKVNMNKESAENLGTNPLQAILQAGPTGMPERPGDPALGAPMPEVPEEGEPTHKILIQDKGMDGKEIKMTVESSVENDQRVNFLANALTQSMGDPGSVPGSEAAPAEEAPIPEPAEEVMLPAQEQPIQ